MFKHNDNIAKNFDILVINVSVLHNYFDGSTKLFSDLYLVKFLNTSTKSFFLCREETKNLFLSLSSHLRKFT